MSLSLVSVTCAAVAVAYGFAASEAFAAEPEASAAAPAQLVHGPVVARLTGALSQPRDSVQRGYRYAMLFKLSRDPVVRAPDGGTATRGSYKLDGIELGPLFRLGRPSSNCFVGYLSAGDPLRRLDKRRIGSKVPTTLRPSLAATADGTTQYAPAQRRRATLRTFDVRLRHAGARAARRRLGCS